jgi:ADP-L-glycero-D-manno-heptose 6-epimerase
MPDRDPQRIVVTGGAGFIGSALVWALNQRGFDHIVVVDRRTGANSHPEKERNLAPLRFDEYLDADEFLTLVASDSDRLAGVGTLFHLGACSSTTETDTEYLRRNNLEYTKTLAHWAISRDVRFIYASSAATYGDGSSGMVDGTGELDSYRPLNPYGQSKHLFDRYARDNGLFERIVGLKYFNVFGPNENHKGEMRSLVNKAYSQIRESGRIKLFKSHNPEYRDGEFGRDFLYVKDAIEMTFHFSNNQVGGLFNVGSGVMSSWNKLAADIFAALDLEPKIEYIDMPDEIRERYQYRTQADLSQLRLAGYSHSITPLTTAVADYVQNYLVHNKHLGA